MVGEDQPRPAAADQGGQLAAQGGGVFHPVVAQVEIEAETGAVHPGGGRRLLGPPFRGALAAQLPPGQVDQADAVAEPVQLDQGAAHADLGVVRVGADDQHVNGLRLGGRGRRRNLGLDLGLGPGFGMGVGLGASRAGRCRSRSRSPGAGSSLGSGFRGCTARRFVLCVLGAVDTSSRREICHSPLLPFRCPESFRRLMCGIP